MAETLTIIPSARKLMDSLRDIGYEPPAAVADLVDNSIDADATQVDIDVVFEGEESWIRIADNGTGMATARMNEVMRYGTDRDYADADLGKFGLGLKTASMSQCRRLTVATRTNPDRRDIEIRRCGNRRSTGGERLCRCRVGQTYARTNLRNRTQ